MAAAALLTWGWTPIRRGRREKRRRVMLAAAVAPLALVTLTRALKGRRFESHRAIARWTLPIWLYVSVTVVVVYPMLYPL